MKRFVYVLILIALALPLSSALAEAQNPSCVFVQVPCPVVDGCELGCPLCASSDCPSCPVCAPCFYTAIPAAKPTRAPVCAATPAPTARPSSRPTLAPVFVPTARPTLAPTNAPVLSPTVSTGDYTTISASAQEQKLLNLVNQDRTANGLPALTQDPELSRLARLKSCDMMQNGYFAHESPTYGNAASMLAQFGYAFSGVGENIAHHATVEKAEAAFLSSDGHRRNIMGSQWSRMGVGVCVDANGFVYVTELFAR